MALVSNGAQAASAQSLTAGSTAANVVTPITITAGNALRYGQFVRPTVRSTLVITPAGVVSGTGDLATGLGMTQTGTGRGPASFAVTGDANRIFAITMPARITIANGGNRMRITALTLNTTGTTASLNGSGSFTLNVGGTLTVAANQALGAYTGTYVVTVTYQ